MHVVLIYTLTGKTQDTFVKARSKYGRKGKSVQKDTDIVVRLKVPKRAAVQQQAVCVGLEAEVLNAVERSLLDVRYFCWQRPLALRFVTN